MTAMILYASTTRRSNRLLEEQGGEIVRFLKEKQLVEILEICRTLLNAW